MTSRKSLTFFNSVSIPGGHLHHAHIEGRPEKDTSAHQLGHLKSKTMIKYIVARFLDFYGLIMRQRAMQLSVTEFSPKIRQKI